MCTVKEISYICSIFHALLHILKCTTQKCKYSRNIKKKKKWSINSVRSNAANMNMVYACSMHIILLFVDDDGKK